MFKGLWQLTWIETKVFVREPMGVIGTLLVPVVLFIALGRTMGGAQMGVAAASAPFNVPVMAALFIAISAVISLVTIISIYREGGILKRLRATPLTPVTILGAHVFVKLTFTLAGLGLLVLAGRRVFPGAMDINVVSFAAALVLGTLSILSMGFVMASLVPTARFAQPLAAALLYPMIAISGLFFPIAVLPGALRTLAYGLPTTHTVTLLEHVWDGRGWHAPSALALIALGIGFTALSSRVFRWE